MFLHLLTDDKFIDSAIGLFSANDPGNHRFILLVSGFSLYRFKYIRKAESVERISIDSEEYRRLLLDLPNFTAIFLHSFINPHNIKIVNEASRLSVFVWIFWGGDIWSLKEFQMKALLPLTKKLYIVNHRKENWKKTIAWFHTNINKYMLLLKNEGIARTVNSLPVFFNASSNQRKKTIQQCYNIKTALQKIQYVIPVIPDDFSTIKSLVSENTQVLEWNYWVSIPFESFGNCFGTRQNILIGNSASYSNNHLEIFHLLKKKHPNFAGKYITPLSYGDKAYRDSIIQKGRHLLGEQFFPLVEFMNFQEYLGILQGCSHAFFNSIRQQAMGNIAMLLFMGAKIFLRNENPIYHFLKRNGAIVFSMQTDISCDATVFDTPLDKASIQQNKNVVMQITSEEALLSKTKTMLAILKKTRPTNP